MMSSLRRLSQGGALVRATVAFVCIFAVFAVSALAYTEVQDAFEPDNTPAEAKALVLGAAKQQRTLHYTTGGDVDWVSFAATEGTSYVIQTGDLDPDTTDTVLELYAPDGETMLAANDDFGFSFASRIAWKAPASGTYYAKIRGRHAGISGAYTLTLREGGAIRGRVTKQGTTKPLAGITVDLWQWDQDGFYANFETTTDADGWYEFEAVPVGTWKVGFYDWEWRVFAPTFYSNKSSVDLANNVTVTAGNTTTGINAALSALPKTFIEVEGANRYATAVKASQTAYPGRLSPSGARTVVIATGRNWPDALGGTALAGVLDGPVLLVDTNAVPGEVMTEIRRLEAQKAVILGGTGAVGAAVESALKTELGSGNVRRIQGSDRYRTADEIAQEVIALQGAEFEGAALVATGGDFPDALAAAPLAAMRGMPLYLADPTTGLHAQTKAAMAGVSSAVILGGTRAVKPEVEGYLTDRFGASNVTRRWGSNRYETACEVASYAVANGMRWDGVGIATGADFPDALSGGAMLGRRGAVLVLTQPTSLPEPVRAALSDNADEVATAHFLGGRSAVSDTVRTAVKNALK